MSTSYYTEEQLRRAADSMGMSIIQVDIDEYVEVAACRREERKTNSIAFIVIVVLLLVMAGVDLAWNQYVYGDWTCAFAKCHKVKVIP